jgi:2-oxoisovalerate dehydrogenase E1 component
MTRTSESHQPTAPSHTGFDPYGALREMLLIRRFEERCLELSSQGEIAGSVHLCLGQEAIPVGAMQALGADDRVVATYRGHGWALARGVPVDPLLAEICQRRTGINGGRVGSPLIWAPEYGFIGENSIVGAGAPIATGVALAALARGEDRVVAVSLGDGAMNQGSTHEALVFAAARSLPVLFICENNGWSEMTATSEMFRVEDIAQRASGYGMTGVVVDGNDPEAVYAAVADAAKRARGGQGPTLLECKTARLSGHYNRDIQHYRSESDIEAAKTADPVERLRRKLAELEERSAQSLEAIETDVQQIVDAAAQAALNAPAPDPEHYDSPATINALASDYAARTQSGSELTYIKAVTAALDAELTTRQEVLVYGEDVGKSGGIFGASRGLQQRHGEHRVFDTPIAESAILGSATGAAMEGLRPVVEIMWGDFLLVALDQLINQAANVRFVTGGTRTASLVVRTQHGVTPGSCAQHSQSLEALLAHIPGLKVGIPATPQDAYSMLRAAVADPDPCILFESRALYQDKGTVDLDADIETVGGARLRRSGSDVVIITWGAMLHQALAAADTLQTEGVSVAVLDLRWLTPIDHTAIAGVLNASSGRVIVAHDANLTGGFGAEISAMVHELHFDLLDAPVKRIGAPDIRIPSAPTLQAALLPDAETIVSVARSLLTDTGFVAAAAVA